MIYTCNALTAHLVSAFCCNSVCRLVVQRTLRLLVAGSFDQTWTLSAVSEYESPCAESLLASVLVVVVVVAVAIISGISSLDLQQVLTNAITNSRTH